MITGEGSFDHQSLRGKVVAGVAGAARDRGVPCVVLAGRVSAGRREAAGGGRHRVALAGRALRQRRRGDGPPGRGAARARARLARQWSRARNVRDRPDCHGCGAAEALRCRSSASRSSRQALPAVARLSAGPSAACVSRIGGLVTLTTRRARGRDTPCRERVVTA